MQTASGRRADGAVESAELRPLLPLILSSGTVRLTLAAFALFAIVYALPLLSTELKVAFSRYVTPVVFLSITIFACRRGIGKRGSPSEDLFWRTASLAFTFWLLVRLILPHVQEALPLSSGVAADVIYAAFYVTLILAIEVRPHLHQSSPFESLERTLNWPAISLFVLGLLIYFVFIPLAVTPDEYATAIPSLYFFLALDLYVGVRLVGLLLQAKSRGWRIAYGTFAAGMFGFAAADVFEILSSIGTVTYALGGPTDLLWMLPILGPIVAARMQRRIPSDPLQELAGSADRRQQILFLALFLPLFHFLGYGYGWFGAAIRETRELFSLVWLLLLGSLAMAQQFLLERRARLLQAQSVTAAEELREKERTLHLLSERQRAVEARKQSELNFSRVFNASPDPMLIFSRDDLEILAVNDAFEAFGRHETVETQGRSFSELGLIHGRDLQTLLDSTAGGRSLRDLPTQVRACDGTVRQCLLASETIEFGGRESVITVFRDVTEQIELEAYRDSLIAQLESKNAELERFTYTVSHDLKSPLLTIKGFLPFVKEAAVSGDLDRLDVDLARIGSAADRMQHLLDELLELSRVGKSVSDPAPVPVEEVIEEALEMVRGPLVERGVEVDVMAGMPVVLGDRTRLVQVMQNLLDNAVKFMGSRETPRIELRWNEDDVPERVQIRIRDNGIGIEPRFHETIFGLFQQIHPREGGTGIGLALVRRIVDTHGGTVRVESDGVDCGATFVVTLPRAPQTPSPG
jgi:PAS domain S-box-containing protein